MKKSLLFLLLFGLNSIAAQVKVGENPSIIDAASILELESSSRVLVITRVTTVEMEAMSPLQGAMVFNEDESCIFYYDGTNWNNLCAGGGGGSGEWGAITGTLTNQTDLVNELQNYVDLSTTEDIGGEKTFTEKLTVSTGDINTQVVEFLGRAKGENGTAPEDFVTKSQLDAVSAGGHTGIEGSVFFANTDNSPTEDNSQFFWDNSAKRLGIGINNPNSNLHTEGSFATNIGFTAGAITLSDTDHTVILTGDSSITLPPPDGVKGRVYVLKKAPGLSVNITFYFDSNGVGTSVLNNGVTWLQSDGFNWQQVN